MIIRFVLFLFLISVLPQDTHGGTFTVDYPNQKFLKDGKPFQYVAGEIHYFRIHPDQWEDRLQRVRAAGLNAIQVYTPWNLHEPVEGQFDFTGIANITRFLDLAQQNNLSVLLRPGPYICAEWEFGGFPWWLIKYPNMVLRTYNTDFINTLTKFYTNFLPVVKPYLYQNGGPILMVQVENEYALWGKCNHNYTAYLRDLFRNLLGPDTVLYTTNPASINISCAYIPDTFTTVDFGVTGKHSDIDAHFAIQQQWNNGGGPKVVSEFYAGWLGFWGESQKQLQSSFPSAQAFVDNLEYIHSINGSISMYMIHGGTNFGFMNGQDPGGVGDLTSYDLHAPISENGNFKTSYQMIHDWLSSLNDWNQKPLPIPANNPASNYGSVTLKRVGSNLISTLIQIQETCQTSADPLSFEELNHPYGFVLYTTTLVTSGQKLSTPNIKDIGYVFLNNVFQGFTNSTTNYASLNLLTKANSGDVLRILVENHGRAKEGSYLDSKGLHKQITLDNTLLQNWYACGINLTKAAVDSLTTSFLNNPEVIQPEVVGTLSAPGVYIGQFTANPIQDTFFNSTGWTKGQLFVNGYNLGRYWPVAGPQVTLYVPKPYIQQTNTVLLIELVGTNQNTVSFIDTPNTGFE